MGLRFASLSMAVAGIVLAFSACSNDYDEFEFVEQPGSGGSSAAGGSGGTTTGGAGGSGGTLTGGSGGTLTGGTGGVVTGGTGGTGATGGAPGCPVGQKSCGGGCVDITDPQYGCGTSGCEPCAIANAQVQCAPVDGGPTCALLSCNDGFFNCNDTLADGCEQTVDTVDHCGSCNRACATTNSTAAVCSTDKCAHTCAAGFGDCTQPTSPTADDGCETNFATSATSCGSCGNSCSSQGAAGGFVCTATGCGCSSSEQCRVGGDAADAVCNTTTGVCACSGTVCKPGEACLKSGPSSACRCNGGTACATGQSCCPSVGCKNLQTDAAHCGACGKACPSGMTCTNGTCA